MLFLTELYRTTGEPEWLATWRHDAWDIWEQTPLPDRVRHLWRYTDPEKFLIPLVGIQLQKNPSVPGIRCEVDFQRIQFTPDLLPADLTGTDIYRPHDSSFNFQPGPLFHHRPLSVNLRGNPRR